MWGARAFLGYGSGGSSKAIDTPWVVDERAQPTPPWRLYTPPRIVARVFEGGPTARSLGIDDWGSKESLTRPRRWLTMVRRLAVLSLHTSPLAQPGSGDSGGMNVYVRELVSSLAQAGVASDVYTRRWADHLPEVVEVEPGFRVVHVPAGAADLAKEHLPEIVDEFTDGVLHHLTAGTDMAADALHANYWLSGVA